MNLTVHSRAFSASIPAGYVRRSDKGEYPALMSRREMLSGIYPFLSCVAFDDADGVEGMEFLERGAERVAGGVKLLELAA